MTEIEKKAAESKQYRKELLKLVRDTNGKIKDEAEALIKEINELDNKFQPGKIPDLMKRVENLIDMSKKQKIEFDANAKTQEENLASLIKKREKYMKRLHYFKTKKNLTEKDKQEFDALKKNNVFSKEEEKEYRSSIKEIQDLIHDFNRDILDIENQFHKRGSNTKQAQSKESDEPIMESVEADPIVEDIFADDVTQTENVDNTEPTDPIDSLDAYEKEKLRRIKEEADAIERDEEPKDTTSDEPIIDPVEVVPILTDNLADDVTQTEDVSETELIDLSDAIEKEIEKRIKEEEHMRREQRLDIKNNLPFDASKDPVQAIKNHMKVLTNEVLTNKGEIDPHMRSKIRSVINKIERVNGDRKFNGDLLFYEMYKQPLFSDTPKFLSGKISEENEQKLESVIEHFKEEIHKNNLSQEEKDCFLNYILYPKQLNEMKQEHKKTNYTKHQIVEKVATNSMARDSQAFGRSLNEKYVKKPEEHAATIESEEERAKKEPTISRI